MDEAKLKRLFKDHRVIFTDSELIAEAFNTSMDFPDWHRWFDEIRNRFDEAEIHKLHVASVAIIKAIPGEADSFKTGAVTPEQSASKALEDSNTVPREFLLFLQTKTKDVAL